MKGIILAGGNGSRLAPCTYVTNKHLLPVYDKPMIYYPIETLKAGGITDILIISGKGHAGDFLELLGDGHEMGIKLSYSVQMEAGGIAQALGLAENFSGQDKVAIVLGDNIIEDNITNYVQAFETQEKGAKLFVKEVADPERFGVAEIAEGKIIGIEEKPKQPKSNLAVVGLYMYDSQVWDVIKTLKPSERGELEITDVNNFYVKQGTTTVDTLNGFWGDAGTFPSLFKASEFVKNKQADLH